MEFKQLEAFVQVAETGSFSKAAGKLFLSQPSVSTIIKKLEEELQTKLIKRKSREIALTSKGEELFEYAKRILELRDRMIEKCVQEDEPVIRIGASTIPSTYLLPGIAAEFGKLEPGISFVIRQSDSVAVMDGMREGLYELGMVGMKCEDKKIACVPFCEDHLVVITPASARYQKWKKMDGVLLESIIKEPMIVRESGSGSKKRADEILQESGISEQDLHIVARVNDQEAIKNLVSEGFGVSMISERAARNFVEDGKVFAFRIQDHDAGRMLYLLYRKDEPMRPCVKKLLKYLQVEV